MAKFVNAATAAEMISEYTGIELYKLVDIVKEVPDADVAPVVHGHWVQKREMVRTIGAKNYTCSECGKEAKYGNYCPNCGAKMDEEANDDKARP